MMSVVHERARYTSEELRSLHYLVCQLEGEEIDRVGI
jgi:hypothetical protein